MVLRSDITINASQFDAANTPKGTADLNAHLIEIGKQGPKWWEVCQHNRMNILPANRSYSVQVGAAKYRELRWNNQTPIPRPPTIETGTNFTIPSRDEGRELPVRMFKPEQSEPRGIMLHIHGGGWVLMSEH